MQTTPRKSPLKTPWQCRWLDLEVTHQSIQVLANVAQAFAGAWFRADQAHPRTIIFAGDTGIGKTHTMNALYHFCRQHAMEAYQSGKHGVGNVPSIVFAYFPKIVTQMEDNFTGMFDDAKDCSVLFLDDVGAEIDRYKNGLPAKLLADLLNDRHRRNSWTIISTNLGPTSWEAAYDSRAFDRMFRNSTIVQMFDVPSYATR